MQEGDFVKIDFTGKVAATGEIFDLTSEEEAKKAGIYSNSRKYGPALVIIGAGITIPGVENQLRTMKVGEEREFNVLPDEAFGSRDPKLIKVLSLAKFREKNINPMPGLFVDIDGHQAKIQAVSGGRVRVDFNHPLAGRELSYRVKIVKQVSDTLQKVRALLEYYTLKPDIGYGEGKLVVKLDRQTPDFIKKTIEKSITKWIPEIKEVRFQEPKKESGSGQSKASGKA